MGKASVEHEDLFAPTVSDDNFLVRSNTYEARNLVEPLDLRTQMRLGVPIDVARPDDEPFGEIHSRSIAVDVRILSR